MIPHRIEPLPGYTPTIGRLVGLLTYARSTLLAAVEGLSPRDLDHLHDAKGNTIGALLAHVAGQARRPVARTSRGGQTRLEYPLGLVPRDRR